MACAGISDGIVRFLRRDPSVVQERLQREWRSALSDDGIPVEVASCVRFGVAGGVRSHARCVLCLLLVRAIL